MSWKINVFEKVILSKKNPNINVNTYDRILLLYLYMICENIYGKLVNILSFNNCNNLNKAFWKVLFIFYAFKTKISNAVTIIYYKKYWKKKL